MVKKQLASNCCIQAFSRPAQLVRATPSLQKATTRYIANHAGFNSTRSARHNASCYKGLQRRRIEHEVQHVQRVCHPFLLRMVPPSLFGQPHDIIYGSGGGSPWPQFRSLLHAAYLSMAQSAPVQNSPDLSETLARVKEFALTTSFEPYSTEKHGGLLPGIKTCSSKEGLQPHADAIRDVMVRNLSTPLWSVRGTST